MGEILVDAGAALAQLFEPSVVTFESTSRLAGEVAKRAAKDDLDRREKSQEALDRKPDLVPVRTEELGSNMSVTPWELLHLLGRATVLSGQGSSLALAQHWGCLKYITSLQSNHQGRMELSSDGRNPQYHRKSVQAEDLGIAFALAAGLRVAQKRHPDHRFEVVDADVALEAGWALKGAEVQSRARTLLRPDYFLVGHKEGEATRLITVECKGSHGKPAQQHRQLAKASAQVHAVVIGAEDGSAVSPPSLTVATALGGQGGIEVRILDPEGDGTLAIPGDRTPTLNGSVQQLNQMAGVPVRTTDGRVDHRPGFYIESSRTEWFGRVLARTGAAALLAFVGDRASARALLTTRQQDRVGADYTPLGTGVQFDANVSLSGMSFVGTDHVFRFGLQRMEAFSGVHVDLRSLLAQQDLDGYEAALPEIRGLWARHHETAEREWGGVVTMDLDGAVLGLRPIGAGAELRYRESA